VLVWQRLGACVPLAVAVFLVLAARGLTSASPCLSV